jgi:hypothetical protein
MAAEERRPEMIKLISKEGHEFTVEKQAAMVSNTIKSMLTGPGALPSIELQPLLPFQSDAQGRGLRRQPRFRAAAAA